MSGWFRLHDSQPSSMLDIEPREAKFWNSKGWGIFATVQQFNGARRKENLQRIRAWAVDLDEGTKEEQRERIQGSPLMPSSVVETKNGYHVYWYAKDAKAEHYRPLLDRLVEFFRADKNARDLARVLRVPGFYHLKDPSDPFLVQHSYGPFRERIYTEAQMFKWFEVRGGEERERHQAQRREYTGNDGDTFWERVYNLDCLDGLERLSGMGCVSGERFTFRRCSSGNHNILVDGKGTSCWVDQSGRIGSRDNGGPTLYAWLRWYGNSPSECARILKEVYPHLAEAA